jgi:TonB family protein
MTRFRFALAAALAAGPALAQPPLLPALAPAVRPWQVDWGDQYCSLVRMPEADRPFALAVRARPGHAFMRIMLVMTEPDAAQIEGVDTILLLPAGTSIRVTTDRDSEIQRPRARYLFGLPEDFAAQLGNATELQLRTGDRIRARVPLNHIRAGLNAQRRCLREVAQEWGVDEAALAALSRRPRSTNDLGLTIHDYPSEAIRRASQGDVTVRITVGAEGRATDCATVATSGNLEIDRTVCRVALGRGRFEPALDANGRPVAIRALFAVGFYLPGK